MAFQRHTSDVLEALTYQVAAGFQISAARLPDPIAIAGWSVELKECSFA